MERCQKKEVGNVISGFSKQKSFHCGKNKIMHPESFDNFVSFMTGSEGKELTFKVYQSEEKDFFQLHEFIIKKQTSKFNALSGQPNYGKH